METSVETIRRDASRQVKALWLEVTSGPVVAARCQRRPMFVNHAAKREHRAGAVYRR